MTKSDKDKYSEFRPIGLNLSVYKIPTEGTDAHGREISLVREENPIRIDVVNDNLTYLGWAEYGSNESLSVWKIRKIYLVGTVWKQGYPDGDQTYDYIWESRSEYNYS